MLFVFPTVSLFTVQLFEVLPALNSHYHEQQNKTKKTNPKEQTELSTSIDRDEIKSCTERQLKAVIPEITPTWWIIVALEQFITAPFMTHENVMTLTSSALLQRSNVNCSLVN